LSPDNDTKVFVGAIFTWAYVIPITMIVIFYSKVYKHVKAHQDMLKEQAKKMNVASLQANKDTDSQSVEIRIAKAAFLIFFLFLCSWTPYAVVAMIGAYGDQ
jgi:r-opsin